MKNLNLIVRVEFNRSAPIPPKGDPMVPEGHYNYLVRRLDELGQRIAGDVGRDGPEIFLISHHQFLRALAASPQIPDPTTIQVFALASPEDQLVEIAPGQEGNLRSYLMLQKQE